MLERETNEPGQESSSEQEVDSVKLIDEGRWRSQRVGPEGMSYREQDI